MREIHKLHSAKGLEAQRAAGGDLLDAEALVEAMAGPQAGVAASNAGDLGAGVANGAVPAQPLLEAAAALRATASSRVSSLNGKAQ